MVEERLSAIAAGNHRLLSPGLTAIAQLGGISTREFSNPIRLPRSIVIGKCLLPARVIVIDLIPGVLYLHLAVIEFILCVEFTVVALKPANDGHWIQLTGGTADPIYGPLLLAKIERTKRQARIAFRGHIQFVHGRQASKVGGQAFDRREFLPFRTPYAGAFKAALPRGPAPNEVIEVMYIAGVRQRIARWNGTRTWSVTTISQARAAKGYGAQCGRDCCRS